MPSAAKPRASRPVIFHNLERLVGPNAAAEIAQIVRLLDEGRSEPAIQELIALDATIGGYCGLPTEFCKPPGPYRPLGYITGFLKHPAPREMARYMIDAMGQHLENLLHRLNIIGAIGSIFSNRPMMGALVRALRLWLPSVLYTDLQWFASEVYNQAKHGLDVGHRPTPEDKAHFFELDEALAICLIGRKLATQLEQLSGKTREELMQE